MEQHSRRIWLLPVLLVAVFITMVVYPTPSSSLGRSSSTVKNDVFEATPLQEYNSDFEGSVDADTNCMLLENNTKYRCVAIILRNRNHERFVYSHDAKIPCLSKDEWVRVSGDKNAVFVTRLSEPKMTHG